MNKIGIAGVICRMSAGFALLAIASAARAEGVEGILLAEPARLDFSHTQTGGGEPSRADDGERASRQTSADFGKFDTTWWTFGAGASTDFDEFSDINVTVAWSKFIDEDIEMMIEVAIREFDMPGDDQVGFNPMLDFKKHWKLGEDHTWTAFADIGIGIMISTGDVPRDGTSFNFTPRFGGGLTYAINDDWRVIAGLRWSHISNGRIYGDDDNPASDGIMFSVGLITSF